MASIITVAIAAILQIVLRISVFIKQDNDLCSTAQTLASWIFLIAFLDVFLDIIIYPIRYMHLPYICQIIAETIVAILLTEFGLLVVWCTIDKICCKLSKSLLLLIGVSSEFYYNWENYILGAITTTVSLILLLYVGQATDHFHFMHEKSLRMCGRINQNLSELWTKLRNMLEQKANNNFENLEQQHQLYFEMLPQPQRNNNNNIRTRGRSRRRSRSRNY